MQMERKKHDFRCHYCFIVCFIVTQIAIMYDIIKKYFDINNLTPVKHTKISPSMINCFRTINTKRDESSSIILQGILNKCSIHKRPLVFPVLDHYSLYVCVYTMNCGKIR